MNPGSVVKIKDKIGIVGFYTPDNLSKYGTHVYLTGGAVEDVYQDLPEITEYTPEVCAALESMLHHSVWSVSSKDYGMTGTDPEIFGFNKQGEVIPAWKWLKPKSENPSIYWDGVQAEFTTGPTVCHNYQTDNVHRQLAGVYSLLRAHDKTAYLATKDVVKLDLKTLLTADDKYVELGCSPSRNAYPEVKPIEIPACREHPFRYSGCHIHQSILGIPLPKWFPEGTVAMIDKLAGVPLTALGRDMEDPKRREAYGRAGEFRIPPPVPINPNLFASPWMRAQMYNRLEYRTPGSFLLHHPALFNFACDTIRAAFRLGLIYDGRKLSEIGDVQGIINNCDADAAAKLVTAKDSFYHKMFPQIGTGYERPATMAILAQGAKASGRFGTDLAENWKLGHDWNNDNHSNGPTMWKSIAV